MKSTSRQISLEFNLPDFKKEDIHIKISRNSLIIKAEKSQQKKIQREDFLHSENTQNLFNYTTTLPIINPKKAKIQFNKGILRITAPKVQK